jgi:hypothetical protein
MYPEQPQLMVQILETTPQPIDPEKARRLQGALTQMSLRDEKVLFELTKHGVSVSQPQALGWEGANPAPVNQFH